MTNHSDEHSKASRGSAWQVALWSLLFLALAVGMGLATMALLRVPRSNVVSKLPALPDLQDKPVALIEHLTGADDEARSRQDADAIGALAMAYHADDFYRQAQECYAVALELDPDNWRWKYYAALLDEDFGNTASAIELLEDVVEVNPTLASAWLRLGRGRFKLNDLEAAEIAFYKVLETDDSSSSGRGAGAASVSLTIHAYYELARVAVERNQLETARKYLEEITQRREDFGPGQRLLDHVLRELGHPRAARQMDGPQDTQVVYIPPHDPLVDDLARESCSPSFLMKQVDVAIRTRRLPWAEYLCRQAVRSDDSDPEAVGMLTVILLNSNRLDDAAPYLDRYLAIGGPEFVLLSMIGKAMLVARRSDLAVQVYEKVLQSNPRHATAHSLYSYILTTRGQHREAIEHCKQSLEIDPELSFAHVNWGNALMALGKIDSAISQFESALNIQPNQASAHAGLGRALLQQGKHDQAVSHLVVAAARASEDIRLQVDLIYALIGAGQFEQAAPILKRVIESIGSDVAQLNRLAWLLATSPHEQNRDGATAVELAERACLATDNENPVCLDVLSVAYAEAGRMSEAIDAATRAATLVGQSRPALAQRIRRHLEHFRAGKPYRDGTPRVTPSKPPTGETLLQNR